jgi:hypothetical protein
MTVCQLLPGLCNLVLSIFDLALVGIFVFFMANPGFGLSDKGQKRRRRR